MKVIIPTRYDSTRFPGKALFPLWNNRPMIAIVHHMVHKTGLFDSIYIATDSKKILQHFEKEKTPIVKTGRHHTGTDRVAEAANILGCQDEDVIINIQGDIPTISIPLLSNFCEKLHTIQDNEIITIATPRSVYDSRFFDVNSVKVKVDSNSNAQYFKREWSSDLIENDTWLHHIGIYAYKKKTLINFTELSQTDNEIKYSLEQYRAMDNKINIKVALTKYNLEWVDVNTMDDVIMAQSCLNRLERL